MHCPCTLSLQSFFAAQVGALEIFLVNNPAQRGSLSVAKPKDDELEEFKTLDSFAGVEGVLEIGTLS